MIEAKGLNKFFGQIHVIKDLDIKIRQGEIVSIVGPSGAGKSTLLQILASLDTPSSGLIKYDDTSTKSLNNSELRKLTDTYTI